MSQQQFDLFLNDIKELKDNENADINTLKNNAYYCYQDCYFSQDAYVSMVDIENNLDAYLDAYNTYIDVIYTKIYPIDNIGKIPDNPNINIFKNSFIIMNLPTPYTIKSSNNSPNVGGGGASNTNVVGNVNNEKVLQLIINKGYINNYTDEGRDNG